MLVCNFEFCHLFERSSTNKDLFASMVEESFKKGGSNLLENLSSYRNLAEKIRGMTLPLEMETKIFSYEFQCWGSNFLEILIIFLPDYILACWYYCLTIPQPDYTPAIHLNHQIVTPALDHCLLSCTSLIIWPFSRLLTYIR